MTRHHDTSEWRIDDCYYVLISAGEFMQQLMTAAEACELLGVSRQTLWLIRRREEKFPKPILVGASLRWVRSELESWIEARRVKS